MSGHSKWANIKHRKGAQDAKKGKVFTKCAREIIMAAKKGGADPEMNNNLRAAILKAKSYNMPNDNIKRAIKSATGGDDGKNYEEVTYEAYLQDGVAIIVDCVTDNKNRTFPEIKTIITKGGGSLAEIGAVSYLFSKKGVLLFDSEKYTEDQVMELALDYDPEDITRNEDNTIEVIIDPQRFHEIKQAFDDKNFEVLSAEISMIPLANIKIENYETSRKIMSVINKLDDHEDVQNVYSNHDISDEIYARLEENGEI